MKVVSVRFESPLQMFSYKMTLSNKLHSKLSNNMCTPGANLLKLFCNVCIRKLHVVNINY